jgi:hypothetical protein
VFATSARAALNLVELPSYRSRTIKGTCVVSDAAVDPALLAESVEAMSRAMHGVGMPADATHRMLGGRVEPAHFVVLRLVVDSVFDQSPKPGAGAPL